MKSRFRDLIFEDFTQPELKEVWLEMSEKANWRLEPNVAEVASRRVSRGRGVKGFANARTVRSLFEESYTRALKRLASARKAGVRSGGRARGSSRGAPLPRPCHALPQTRCPAIMLLMHRVCALHMRMPWSRTQGKMD